MANSTTTSAIRPLNGVAPGLRGNNLLLEACQQQLSVGYGQTEIGDMAEIIRSVDLHNVDALLFTIFPGFYQPHNPSHASTSGQRTDAKIPLRRSHPRTCDGPVVGPCWLQHCRTEIGTHLRVMKRQPAYTPAAKMPITLRYVRQWSHAERRPHL